MMLRKKSPVWGFLEHNYKFSLHFSIFLEVLPHLRDRPSCEFFELLCNLAADDDRSVSSEILFKLTERLLETMY